MLLLLQLPNGRHRDTVREKTQHESEGFALPRPHRVLNVQPGLAAELPSRAIGRVSRSAGAKLVESFDLASTSSPCELNLPDLLGHQPEL